MPISTSQLLADIQPLLAPLAKDAQQSNATWDLFEVLTFGLVARAARDAGATVDFLDTSGSKATRYLFRSSPGPLANPGQNFIHAEIRFDSLPALEAHNGIWVIGKSLLPHECDCVVLRKDEADAVRASGRSPLWGTVLLHAECKYYAQPIPFWQGRNFLGLSLDLGWKGGLLLMNRRKATVSQLIGSRKRSALRLQPGNSVDRQAVMRLLRRRFLRYEKTGDV